MRIKANQILFFINALTVLFIIIITFFPNEVLRIVLGIPLVLLFPGYTLLSALFPRRISLSDIERFALSFALSVAVVPLIGLLLNFLPWGIRLYPILISLFIFFFIMSGIAWYRGKRFSPEEKVSLQISFKFPHMADLWANRTRGDKILSILLVMVIIGAIGTLVYVGMLPRTPDKYTEFYVLDSAGKAENYPSSITLGQSGEVILEIINHEYAITDYRVEINIDGVNTGEIGDIKLDPENKWEQIVTFTPTHTGNSEKVEFLLYKGTATNVYENVHVWISVK